MDIRYPATLEPQQGGGYFVQFVDFADIFTEGDSIEEALFNASEVLSAMLGWRLDQEGAEFPHPSRDVAGAVYIAPDAKTQAAMLMRLALSSGDRSVSILAKGLATSWAAAKRLTDPHHSPSLRSIDRAASLLGLRLVLVFEDANQSAAKKPAPKRNRKKAAGGQAHATLRADPLAPMS